MQISYLRRLNLSLIILSGFYVYDANAAVRCVSCDSTQNKNCAIKPDDITLDLIECDGLKTCAMSVVGEITYRGCSGDIYPGDYFKTCDRNMCNDVVFPPGRQKCFQCEGEECVKEPSGKAIPCVTFLEDDGCFTDVISEKNAIRGCKSDNKTLSANAVKCPYNSCNDKNGVQKRTCLECNDSKTGCKRALPPKDPTKECILDEKILSNCTVEYLLGRPNETCFTYHRLNKVERGCTSLRPDLSSDTEHILMCNDDKCNNKCLNVTQCVSCDSGDEKKCKDNPKDLKLNACGPEESSCHAKLNNNGIITRGCGTPWDLSNAYHCQGNGCNVKDIQKCYSCSSKDDPNCSQWTNPNTINHMFCETPDEECFTAVNADDKFTVRGCKKPKMNCDSNSNCRNCTGVLCNSGIFPESRLKCHHCEKTEICDRDQRSNSRALSCIKYDLKDECIEFSDSDGKDMFRGCKSDLDLYKLCEKHGDKCHKCSSEGCNYHKIMEKSKLSCFVCDDTQLPVGACSWAQKNDTLVKCKNNVMYYDQDTCFININSNGQVSRGCSVDVKIKEICQDNSEGCKICDSNGCNRIQVFNQSCVQCHSTDPKMKSCKDKAAGINPTLCAQQIQFFEKRGCFVNVNSKNNVTRGCAFDLTNTEFDLCSRSKNKNCKYCQGNNCNMIQAPDFFGAASKMTGTLWIFIIIFGFLNFI